MAKYFRSIVPADREYYLHHFTIKKGSNYYGLIFGSGHTLGMEKFLKVCWEKDKLSGESNFAMYHDFKPDSLFYTETETVKINDYKASLKTEIRAGTICSNLDGMKHALYNGVQAKVWLDVLSELNDEISVLGKMNKKVTNIHRLKGEDIYTIKIK